MIKILASRKRHMRQNPSHNPAQFVYDLEKILRKSKKKLEIGTVPLIKSFSLPKEGVISIDDVSFYIKFELSLFR